LKLVMGVDISRREVRREGSEVWVWRSRRRRNAARRTSFRRLEGVSCIDSIAERWAGGLPHQEMDGELFEVEVRRSDQQVIKNG
jgi:hypothetical protein